MLRKSSEKKIGHIFRYILVSHIYIYHIHRCICDAYIYIYIFIPGVYALKSTSCITKNSLSVASKRFAKPPRGWLVQASPP